VIPPLMASDTFAPLDQSAIVAAIESGLATGEHRPLKRIDTHMSHVFLGRDRVYKLNRSIRHPFADLSSLEARRLACEAELIVNKVLAPDLYEAVLAVTRQADGAIRIGGVGEPLDWVVAMRRFADGALLEEIANAGRLTPELIAQTAEIVAAFHSSLQSRADVGHAVDYRRIIEGLRRTEDEGAAALDVLPASQALFDRLDYEVGKHAPLIEARRRTGWVRRGHGDLHLRNICLFRGRVTPFDALEFDPALATADVIYDVAFLLMDLRARGLDQLANVAMNGYWDASRQPEEALALLPLFMSLRAAVRMAVAVEAGDLVQAARYRRLGLDLLRPESPRLLAIGGLSGTGKSTLARIVAPELPGVCGGRVLRTDVIRKAVADIGPAVHLADEAYLPSARAEIYRTLAKRAGQALTAGSSVIADATFREQQARTSIEDAADGNPFTGWWLKASTAVRIGRVAARRADVSDATAAVALAQIEPASLGPAWRVLDADGPINALADDARQALRREAGHLAKR
jgi:aminoglycoside phosphotransferase family enzyme/predicted kinase